MALLAITYCTAAEIERRHGTESVLAWSDHDGDGLADSEVLDDAINQATQEIDLYARQRYAPEGLADSPLVNRWAVIIAAYMMSITRSNPPPDSLAIEFERVMARLAEVKEGSLALPGVPMRSDMRPSMSNLRIDRRYPKAKIRVQKEISTDQVTTLPQNAEESVYTGAP